MIDDIKKEVETTSDPTPEKEVMYVDYSNVYENEIKPLATKLFEVSEKTGIPVFLVTQIKTDKEGVTYASTGSADKNKGASHTFFHMVNEAKYILKHDPITREQFVYGFARAMVPVMVACAAIQETDLSEEEKVSAFTMINDGFKHISDIIKRL